MNNFEKKEKNLNDLIERLQSLNTSYTQSSEDTRKISYEKNQLILEKKEIEKKNQEPQREHKYLKEKLIKLQEEVNSKSDLEDKFNQDIEELSEETENLVQEINKWQM